jgi:hypothetical protein
MEIIDADGEFLKNQYFGDTRDLFKYDLILELLLKSNFLERFTFIPMLTERAENLHGKRTNYDNARSGTRRKELIKLLRRCIAENRRNIVELEGFFRSLRLPRRVEFEIYRKDEFFSHETRARYFSEISGQLMSRSVILVDPDIGLEVKSMKNREEKYVTYAEVELLFSRMDRNSLLVIFQFVPRVKRRKYFIQIGRKLKRILRGSSIVYVSDNQVVFFILTKTLEVQNHVANTINEYSRTCNLITGTV